MPSCGARYNRSCTYSENCYEWEDDGPAWRYLEESGYTQDRFLIKIPKDREPTDKEWAALCFLANEWDWSWENEQ